MAENESKKTNYIDTAMTAGVKKAAESLLVRAVDKGFEYYKTQNNQLKVQTGEAYTKYLDNAYARLNQMKTLATGLDTVSILGENSVYVNMSVRYRNYKQGMSKDIDVISVEDLLTVGRNILITGTGGAGKTMMMKYLFLNTKNRNSYVPVFLELRKVSAQKAGEISIPKLIYTCMKDYDVELSEEMLEYSLQYGGYLFLFDGYDEVKESLADATAQAIQSFCARYPNNIYVVTSRENANLPIWFQTFEMVKALPLDLEKAVQLASRLGNSTDKNKVFCEELRAHLYKEHKDFAENPLLLTMMYLVHMRNGSVPDYLADFYGKCFEALYSAHDSFHKENYARPFRCDLSENEFRRIFAGFCFATYFREKYEFDKKELLSFLKKSIAGGTDKEISAEDFLHDLTDAVCLMIEEGWSYKFTHRNFQSYFAAMYIAEYLDDEEQKKIGRISMGNHLQGTQMDFHRLLYQINGEKFKRNILEPALRELMEYVEQAENPDRAFLKAVYSSLFFLENIQKNINADRTEGKYTTYLFLELTAYGKAFCYLVELVLKDFNRFPYNREENKKLDELLTYYVEHIAEKKIVTSAGKVLTPSIRFSWLDALVSGEYVEFRDAFYQEVLKVFRIAEARETVLEWLDGQEEKRKKAADAKELDAFLDALI